MSESPEDDAARTATVRRKTSASQALRETDGGQKAGGVKDKRQEKEVGRCGGGSGGRRDTGKPNTQKDALHNAPR